MNERVSFLFTKCRILKYLKRIIVLICITFFYIQPLAALDFSEIDSTAYVHEELPEIEAIALDDKNPNITYIKLHKPVNGCLNVFIDELSFDCVPFTNGIGVLRDAVFH